MNTPIHAGVLAQMLICHLVMKVTSEWQKINLLCFEIYSHSTIVLVLSILNFIGIMKSIILLKIVSKKRKYNIFNNIMKFLITILGNGNI